ncbi:MAG: A/G-specific adenine glycosylase [Candidatus Binatia bacterium]
MQSKTISHIRRNLLSWYNHHQRDLPWRRTRDPYAIWIAETMLQQTQVKTVLPYYHRFMRAFPTIQALDGSSKEKVLALWSGLGYYRRVENLKKAARRIIRDHKGQVPRDFNILRTLPGIGPYTAGALMSIAFGKAYPALDGNARRVLARIFTMKQEKELNAIASRLVAPSNTGRFNQALMELGATTCLAREPKCSICPLARFCKGRQSGLVYLQNPPSNRQRIKPMEWPLALVKKNGKILLHRRPPGGLLGGLWELPGGERIKEESVKTTLARHLRCFGRQVRSPSLVGEIRHTITRHRIRAPLFTVAFPRSKMIRLPHQNWCWCSISSLHRYPLSSLCLKAVRLGLG